MQILIMCKFVSLLCGLFRVCLCESVTTAATNTENYSYRAYYDIKKLCEEQKILPDVIGRAPEFKLEVAYNDTYIDFGTFLTIDQIQREPTLIRWPSLPTLFYTLMLISPDYPTRENPIEKEWQYWLLTNIPYAGDTKRAQVMTEYSPPTEIHGKEPHRMIFLAFMQRTTRPVNFTEPQYTKECSGELVARVFFLLQCILHHSLSSFALTFKDIKAELKGGGVVPDVIDEAPKNDIEIRINGTSIDLGNRLNLNSLIEPPEVIEWETQRHGMYSFMVTGPDVPSREQPFEREYMHWQIVNIPGKNYTQGETLVTYVGSQFCCNPGNHRMVYTVWKQPKSKPMNFPEERRIDNRTHYLRRACFNTRKFAKKYNMTLWAANFLIVECCIE